MIFLKNKLSGELKDAINEPYIKNLRVLIEFSNLGETAEKKLRSMGCTVFYRNNFIKIISAEVSPKNMSRLIELPYIKYISLDKHCYLCGSNILSSNGISSSAKLTVIVWDSPGSNTSVFAKSIRFADAFSIPPFVYGGL